MMEPEAETKGVEPDANEGPPLEKEVELSPEEYEALLAKKKLLDEAYRVNMRKWSTVVFYAGFCPSIMALWNIVLGVWIRNTSSSSCVEDLKGGLPLHHSCHFCRFCQRLRRCAHHQR
jgi:hypothetical protein